MNKEWTDYFEFVCSMYGDEILEALADTECKTEEERENRYYEQASLIALRHFIKLLRETGIY